MSATQSVSPENGKKKLKNNLRHMKKKEEEGQLGVGHGHKGERKGTHSQES